MPALDGCFTYGATLAEAIEHAHDTIRVHVEALVDNGGPVPDGVKTLLTAVQVEIPETVSSL